MLRLNRTAPAVPASTGRTSQPAHLAWLALLAVVLTCSLAPRPAAAAEPGGSDPVVRPPPEFEPHATPNAGPPPKVILDLKPDPTDPGVEKKRPLDEILVLVNGIPIYSHSLDDAMDAMVKAAPTPPDAVQLRNARRNELQNLVQTEIIRQFIKANSLKVNETSFAQYIDYLNKEATSRFGEPLQSFLHRNGQDYDQWYRAQRYVFMLRDFAAKQLTDSAIDAYIQQTRDQLPLRRARHILVAFEGSIKYAVPGRTEKQALAKANELIKRLDEGANFSELAMAESDSPEALDGGLLPFVARKPADPGMELASKFVDALYGLKKVGDYTHTPVQTPYGFHIIQLVDLRRNLDDGAHPMANLRKYVMNTPEHFDKLVETGWVSIIDKVRTRSTVQYFGEFSDLNEKKAPDQAPGANAHGANDGNLPAPDVAPAGGNPADHATPTAPAKPPANVLPPQK
ncbi:MAG: peptidylprolyl isomerase [Planctomycetota bacterium]